MMKKFLIGCTTAVFLVGCMVGGASAALFTDIQNVDVTLAEGPVADWFFQDTVTYTHTTPDDFEVPWDIVNSATLTIAGYWVNGDNDTISVEGTTYGNLVDGGTYGSYFSFDTWSWINDGDNPSNSIIGIDSAFASWTTGDSFDVTIAANGSFGNGGLSIGTSKFVLDYVNGAAPAPVPEPSTMLLFGAGLVGLAGVTGSRRKKKKDLWK